jgi:hypothetical protein
MHTEFKMNRNTLLKETVTSKIIKIKSHGGVDTYVLENGYEFGHTSGSYQVGDTVRVSPYIMGTVKSEKVS